LSEAQVQILPRGRLFIVNSNRRRRLVIKKILAVFAGFGLAALVLSAPASATETTPKPVCAVWKMRGATGAYPNVTFGSMPEGSNVGKYSARLAKPTGADAVQPGVEFASKDLGVEASAPGREVSVDFETNGPAKPDAGAIRLFGYKTSDADTLHDGPDFQDMATSSSGKLKFTLPAGTKLGTLGVVFDASNDSKGSVTFSDMMVGEARVQFTTCVEPTSTPTATPTTTKPTTTPPTSRPATTPTATKTSSVAVGGGTQGGGTTSGGQGLPVTGTPVGLLAGGAAVLLALGGALVYANRKRRTSFTA
jgi:hypothetical protein